MNIRKSKLLCGGGIIVLCHCCYPVFSQTNVKSGNIRACDVWNKANQLNNATIISGTVIQSNSNKPSATSITFQGNGAIELNGNDEINLGSPTDASFCTKGTLASNSKTFDILEYIIQYGNDVALAYASPVYYVPVTISGLPAGGATVKITASLYEKPSVSQSISGCYISTSTLLLDFYVVKNKGQVGTVATLTRNEEYNPYTPGTEGTIDLYLPVVNGDVLEIAVIRYTSSSLCGRNSITIRGHESGSTVSINVQPGYF